MPPYGEAILVVDTDLPVPAFASRLRVDLYTPDGRGWYYSNEVPLRDATSWPASFSLYTKDTARGRLVLVRLRAFPEEKVRDYRGERFASRALDGAPADPAFPAPADCGTPGEHSCQLPRLMEDGVDRTPASEPQPFLAVDRLVLVRLTPGEVASVRVVMRGACVGTMADLSNLASCIDTDATLSAVAEAPSSPDLSIPPAVAKDFGASIPCPDSATPRPGRTALGTKLYDAEVCVPGGAFVFGNETEQGFGESDGVPQRVVSLPPFYLDRYEVTVGRWRDALAHGFKPPASSAPDYPGYFPAANDTPLARDTCAVVRPYDPRWCSWTRAKGIPEDRESYAMTCVDRDAARAFCQFEGGDLPTEAQWEYVAQVVGRETKTVLPWGSEVVPPACTTVVTSQCDVLVDSQLGGCSSYFSAAGCVLGPVCPKSDCGSNLVYANPNQGPQPVDARDHICGDRALVTGVVGLGGGVAEYTQDDMRSLGSKCWAVAPLVSPSCVDPSAPDKGIRGSSWADLAGDPGDASRRRVLSLGPSPGDPSYSFNPPQVGFRCARPVVMP